LDPIEEYKRRLEHWRAAERRFQRQFIRIGNERLAAGIAFAILAALAAGMHAISGWWLLGPVAVFIALMIVHSRVIRQRDLAARAARYYQKRMLRLGDSSAWAGNGQTGERFRDPSHVYSEDLDLFGKGSLFELVSCARTAAGEETLASWLLSPADCETALARQTAITELRGRLDLRERIAFIGEEIRSSIEIEKLEAWASAPALGFPAALRWAAVALALSCLATLVLFLGGALPIWPFAAVVAVNIGLIAALRKRVAQIVHTAVSGPDLLAFSSLLAIIETERFESPLLVQLAKKISNESGPASVQLRGLQRWVELADSSDHLLVRVLQPVLLWKEQAAMGLENERQRAGVSLPSWIRTIAQFEALSSFATLAFERPHWTFPQLEQNSEPCFEIRGMTHPLMAPGTCVPNDLHLCGGLRLLIVSGSNMSGKSTLLRSIGLNTVLAWAGAPAAASHMRISLLQPAASIRIQDSLQDNRSRFFAEIMRLRQILDLIRNGNGRRILFLLDELLSGTNSHDRRIGAAGIVRGFIDQGAMGLVTTHDLALSDIASAIGPAAVNVHFEDRFTNGKIEFDYRLVPGIVTRSNALELMRAIGLEV
jgi:hypothetical protein